MAFPSPRSTDSRIAATQARLLRAQTSTNDDYLAHGTWRRDFKRFQVPTTGAISPGDVLIRSAGDDKNAGDVGARQEREPEKRCAARWSCHAMGRFQQWGVAMRISGHGRIPGCCP